MHAGTMSDMPSTVKPLSIFRPGRHVTTSGHALEFTEADVAATASAYDPAKSEAPLVIGHPKLDAPAYGWAQALSFADGLLQAIPRAVSAQFAEWVNAGAYKKISAAFYPPDSPGNPVPGVYYLRHIGFLGAQPPAVKGLPDPQFADGTGDVVMVQFAAGDDFLIIEFSEQEQHMAATTMTAEELAAENQRLAEQQAAIDAKNAEFAEREAKLKQGEAEIEAEQQKQKDAGDRAAFAEFLSPLIAAGKLLPRDKPPAIEFMMGLRDNVEFEFAEGDATQKAKSLEWFKGFLQALPKQIEFSEIAGAGKDPEKIEFAAPAGYAADPRTLEIHAAAESYRKQHHCDYDTAVKAVAK
jgi:hypothetical protein